MSSLVFRWPKSRRCSYCERRWPATEKYLDCPCCREPTMTSDNEPTLTPAQAATETKYFQFGWWLWDSGHA